MQTVETDSNEGHSSTGPARTGAAYTVGVLVAVAAIALMAKGLASVRESAGPGQARPVSITGVGLDSQRFILNGLLAPSLDAEAVPLRWVDPRPALQCGPGARVRVDGEQLVAGSVVPDTPFELEWHADDCRPFGTRGPRFDGDVTLTVFREDWGFSAVVVPRGLRITKAGYPMTVAHTRAATMPQSAPDDDLLVGQ